MMLGNILRKIYPVLTFSCVMVEALFSQNCRVVLTSGETYSRLTCEGIVGDTLVTRYDNGELQPIPVGQVRRIELERRGDLVYYVRTWLVGSVLGGTIGFAAGALFSELALPWLSNDENPKGWISNDDVSDGDMAIVRVFTGMSTALGILHGCGWARERTGRTDTYDLSDFTRDEKVRLLSDLLERFHDR